MAPGCQPAERAGFEPAVHLLSVRSLSKRLPSTTRPPLPSPLRVKREGSMSSTHTAVNALAALAFALASAAAALLVPGRAAACSCMAPPPPGESRDAAAAVFEGRVLSITPGADPTHPTVVRLAVVRTWKAAATEEITVTTAADSAMCGFN